LQPGDPGYVVMTCCHNAVKLKKVTVKVKYLDQEQISVTLCDSLQDRYRFGFNGMEKDNELKGIGNSLDFGARMYDSRLGRWLSLDPLAAKYTWLSPYNFCGNNPIFFVDPNGKAIYGFTTLKTTKNPYKLAIDLFSQSDVVKNFLAQYSSLSKGDNLSAIEGKNSKTNINFDIHHNENLKMPSSAMIEVFDGKDYVNISAFNGTLTKEQMDRIRVNVKLGYTSNQNTGDKVLTISHELFVHGAEHAAMIDKFSSGQISFNELRSYQIEQIKSDKQHLDIFKGSNILYETANDELYNILKAKKGVDFSEGDLTDVYKSTKGTHTYELNKKGYSRYEQQFKFERDFEKNTMYNPNECGKFMNALTESCTTNP
jgi:RHS repeat-associated protein